MAVIKQAHSHPLAREAVILDMGDLGRQAQRILNEARDQSDRLIRQAQTEANRLFELAKTNGHEQGFSRGLTEGREKGLADGRAQAHAEWTERLTELSQRWTDALIAWDAQRAAMLHEAREDVIQCVISLTRKVIMRSVHADSTIIRDQLTEALALIGKTTAIEIVIHPKDRAIVEERLKEVLEKAQSCQHATIREDESITPGGCVVNSASGGGHVDATIETQLDRIAEAMLPAAESGSS